ncbi:MULTISPECIES: aspartate aminotransferase family protein [Clostridium]|uniref:(S)-3-amino-2-methylpropionate transaminase n=2 Tax=Clostridium TaxID=1485 RepID=C4IIY4_CLOBU|nr:MULTISPECIES: aspartate aminotransferase family protein [Clostridium]AXB84453.1 aspartate aminotransferase family protein [Clostridium butyricum]EDT76978.1 4-aminobutyrate aminotransferase [Clostridium butyricum 5521]EEP54137.1 4-aminobutyrate transaminase [Clostridium butyricum E4 str. BoNT E BL5262]KIU07372.1 4-aminobutyrate aminotransferase [Clostridium butyricum]KJZ84888.1 Gamma-aminobutyrate:alpha-ketoglutarate aminotransferase [Clostridium sp. IBUN125C]
MLRDELPKIITEILPGPKAKEVIKRREEAIPRAIKCVYPVVIERGEGAMIEDVDGNRFLDWIGGVGVLNVGFSHPEIIEEVKKQSEKYFHGMFNIVTHEGYVKLAEKLNDIVPVKGDKKKTYFANSGAEADENAVKVAKAFTKRPNIICFSGAFHGRTNLTMAMTSKKAYAKGLGPFPEGIYRAEYPYLYRKPKGMNEEEAIKYYINSIYKVFEECSPADYIAAIVVEPLQGEGGFIPAPIEWVKAVRKICDENGIMLIADEVQSGFCRTGKMFASEYWKEAGVMPDILATAKSIGAGLPISAIVAREEIMESVLPGTIGGTYCGNPLACAAAIKTIEIMERDNLAKRSLEIGEKVQAVYKKWMDKYEVIGDVRGLGGMIGIEFVTDKQSKTPNGEIVSKIVKNAVEKGLMLENSGTYGQVIRFLAPLVMTDEQLKAGLEIFEEAIKKALN